MTTSSVNDLIRRAGALDDSVIPSQEPPAEAGPTPQVEELREQVLRLAAELENHRKRAQRELEKTRRYGTEQLLADLLPVLDAADRALAYVADAPEAFAQGVHLIARQAEHVLAQHGVESYASLGQPFDPARHDAVGVRATREPPPGIVVEEQLKGYLLHDRLLRPARVIVSVAAGPEDAGPEAAA